MSERDRQSGGEVTEGPETSERDRQSGGEVTEGPETRAGQTD